MLGGIRTTGTRKSISNPSRPQATKLSVRMTTALRRPRNALATVSAVIAAISLSWLLAGGPPNAEGAISSKVVYGTVYDSGGLPVAGADVRVEIWGGAWPDADFLRITKSTVTDYSGYYQVTINANYWDPHNSIWVFATDGVYQGQKRVEADAEGAQMVDVNLAEVVPEFNAPLVVVLVSAVGTLLVGRRMAARNSHR